MKKMMNIKSVVSILLMILFISTITISAAAENKKAVKFKRSTETMIGPFVVRAKKTPDAFEATADITTNYKISLGALLHFNVPSYMEPTRISFSGYLEDADSGDTIKRVPEVGITQDIKYKKAVEEFQIWGNGYIKCNKGTWCLYEAVADNFPEDLKLKTYFCLTNYAPSEVSNRMMK